MNPEGVEIRLQSPLGELRAAVSAEGLHRLEFVEPALPILPDVPVRMLTTDANPPWMRILEAELRAYFQGQSQGFTIPLRPRGTPFQTQVWNTLLTIPYGETLSYAEVARAIGRPGACRAVGNANGANPIALIIPCHRVVQVERRLGGYGGGLNRKRFLLDLEGAGMSWPESAPGMAPVNSPALF